MNIKKSMMVLIVTVVTIVGIAGAGCLGGEGSDAVRWTTVAPIDQKAQLEAGNIEGAITWEPYASDAVLDGTAKIWKWSSEIWPGHPCCVVAADQDFMENNEDLVLRFLKVHMVANEWIDDTMENPDSENYSMLLDMGAEFSQRNQSVVESSLTHLTLDYNITNAFLEGLENITQKYIDLGLIEESALQDAGYSNVTDFVQEYVDESLLTQAASIQPSDTIVNPDNPIQVGYLVGDVHQLARVVAVNGSVGDGMFDNGKNLFESYGLAVEASEGGPYSNGGAEMEAFATGVVDIGYLGSPPAILKHINQEVNTIILSQVNSEGSAIFVDHSIETLDDFKGKTFATPGVASIQHLMFLDYFTSQGLEVKSA